MPQIKKTFSVNLKKLVEGETSIAHICRETSINRQQFNRYLAGENLPSELNISKIAKYFKIQEAKLFKINERIDIKTDSPEPLFNLLNKGFVTAQEYISDGRYYFYFPSPGPGEHFIRGLFIVTRKDERIRVDGCICACDLAEPTRFNTFSRFTGLAREIDGNVIILCGFTAKPGDLLSLQLRPVPTGNSQFFSGLVTSTRGGAIMSRRTAVERLDDETRLLTLIHKCGAVPLENADIDPWVRAAIGSDDGDWAAFMQPKSFSSIVNNFKPDAPA